MDFFSKKSLAPDLKLPPIRSLRYRPTELEPRPYIVKIGGVFPVKDEEDLEVTDILWNKDVWVYSGKIMFDVYVRPKGKPYHTWWKSLPWRENLDIEYRIDF